MRRQRREEDVAERLANGRNSPFIPLFQVAWEGGKLPTSYSAANLQDAPQIHLKPKWLVMVLAIEKCDSLYIEMYLYIVSVYYMR
jgi:hypothetical protein